MSSKTPRVAVVKTKSVPKIVPRKRKLLFVTTRTDISAQLFDNSKLEATQITYDADAVRLQNALKQSYDFVYFRDPFNDTSLNVPYVQKVIEQGVQACQGAYFVDGVMHYDDMLFEDKWLQYQRFSDFMPQTELLHSFAQAGDHTQFIKKRISSRSKGIVFSIEDFEPGAVPEDYIVQPRLNIEVEYRVFVIGGKVVLPLETKRNKTEVQTTRVTGLEKSSNEQISSICQQVYVETQYDFMGLDVAKVHGSYVLLEVNRSPQCKGYLRAGGPNLVALLYEYLSNPAH